MATSLTDAKTGDTTNRTVESLIGVDLHHSFFSPDAAGLRKLALLVTTVSALFGLSSFGS